jgi:hypothetical protein
MDVQLEIPQRFKDQLSLIAEESNKKRYSEARFESIKEEEKSEEENRKLQAIKAQIQIDQMTLKKQTSIYALFFEKWDGRLPEIFTSSKETLDIIGEIISDKSIKISTENKKKQAKN